MPTEKHLPRSIDAWLKQLDEVRLPIASHHHEAVRRVLLDSRRSLREIAEQIALPPELAGRWFNRGYYGTMKHNSRAVYQRYLGWYDANPANLNGRDRLSTILHEMGFKLK